MATTKQSKRAAQDSINPFINPAREVQRNTLEREVENSFLPYAISVIIDRAIPSALDGTLPVQRRILYSMYEDGYTPDKNHVKSAKIVGAVIGNYHPHGDSACYGSMARMAQGFNFYLPLVDGHGAFGEQPGDEPAAPRYTEARLSKEAMLLVEELKEEVVDFVPNYDNSLMQPTVLPVKFPNLLINGAKGIAVGFATNMPTHNPGEVIDATRWLLKHPTADLDKLMTFIPGPDFSTGGQIIGQDAIRQAYETGRGTIKIRSTVDIESIGRGKHVLTFTELPYGVSAEKIIEKVKEGLDEGRLQGISDIKDLTDRNNGIRLTIETKAGVNPQAILNELYTRTPLQESFPINNIALVDDIPRLLGLKEMLELFIAHRIDVVTRRTKFRKDKKEARLHILDAMLKALIDIDRVIELIRGSATPEEAQATLMTEFTLDEIQADYILAINLRRLTKFEKLSLETEQEKLQEEIKELSAILADENVLRDLIGKELLETKKVIDRPRRSVLVDGNLAEHLAEAKKAVASLSVEIEDAPCVISLDATGRVARHATKPLKNAVGIANTTTRGKFIAVTNKGNAFRIDALHVAEKPAAVVSVLPSALPAGEKVITLTPVALEAGKTGGIAMGTKRGVVKLQPVNWPKTQDEFSILALADGDEIIGARWVEDVDTTNYVFVSSDSSLLVFKASTVRGQNALTSAGMAGIKLAEGAEAIEFSVVTDAELDKALVVTHSGTTGKASKLSLFNSKGRATSGMRAQKFNKGEEILAYASVSVNPVLVSASGSDIPVPAIDPRRDGSGKPFELPVK